MDPISSLPQSFPTLCDLMDYSTPGLPVHHSSRSLLKLMSIESVMPSNYLILCHPLLLLPSIFPASGSFQMSQLFASGDQNIGGSASTISPSNEHPGLISFRMDWLDLFAFQGTLKSLLQHHSAKASVFQCSILFMASSHIPT